MPWYNDLRPESDYKKKDYALIFPQMTIAEKQRTITNLLALREGLDAEIRPKRSDTNLIVGSWNIKEFGHTTQRLPEAYFYIAEIINRYDLVAVQEIKSRLKDLNIIMRLLGKDWAYMVNDITEGDKGNSERSAYLYNKKRVELTGVAGEIVLWDELTENSDIKQLKRTPYMTGFRAKWKQFSMINLHLHPGDGYDDILYRKKEVELLLAAIGKKLSDKRLWNDNLIIVGDMNLYYASATDEKDDPTVQMFYDNKFMEVESLKGLDTNASKTEAYDRMFLTDNEYFKIVKDFNGKEIGNVFDPFKYVYKDGEEDIYKEFMKDDYTGTSDLDVPQYLKKYYKHPWRKNQLSDHFPIWTELIIDSSDDFLKAKLGEF